MKLKISRLISRSFALRLSLRFMFILTPAVMLLSVVMLLFIRYDILKTQTEELKKAEKTLFHLVENNIQTDSQWRSLNTVKEIPYYMTYIVYETDTLDLIATNDPFLPLLEDTHGAARTFFMKDYFFDGDLDIRYFASEHEILNRYYTVCVAINRDNDSFSRSYMLLPRVIALTVFPILLISFILSFYITQNTINPVIKITRTAQSLTSENLGELLPLTEHNDEIDELSKTFNKLFRQLKTDFDRERQFSSDVSHELNTPLTVILGQAGLLLRWGKDNPEQLEKSLNAIKQEGKSMQAIIANLLQISRIESGRIKPQIEKISLKELFERLSNEVSAISADSHIQYKINDKSGNISVNTDGEMLHQIMTVLISNSVKFSLGKCNINLTASKDGEKTVIEEIDDGPGFANDSLPHIFERFYRGDEAHSRKVSGSGLGLSIANTLITALDGTISAKNAVPHGAHFTITL